METRLKKENKKNSELIKHRSVMMLPTRLSYWALTVISFLFFMLFLGYFIYTRSLVQDLEKDAASISQAAAQFYVNAVNPTTGLEDPDMVELFIQSGKDTEVLRELVSNFDSPLAITDSTGMPKFWISIGVPTDYTTDDLELLGRVERKIHQMDIQNPPVRIYDPSLAEAYVIHYGYPSSLERLRVVPIYLGGILGFFVLIAVWILLRQARTERSLIWAGMARESAHQLGTPLSSLHGWLELLKMNRDSSDLRFMPDVNPEAVKREEEIILGIGQDIDRLSKVANRFELIGRRSTLQEIQIEKVLRNLETYFRARLPKRGKKIELKIHIDPLPPVNGNPTLLEWAFENLIKNSIDALSGTENGEISIRAYYDRERSEVDITFSDNGPGISRDVRHHIFETGVTTKAKGWGVGLALTRRIIEENHGGDIFLSHSSPEKGTVFLICLPTPDIPENDSNEKDDNSGNDE